MASQREREWNDECLKLSCLIYLRAGRKEDLSPTAPASPGGSGEVGPGEGREVLPAPCPCPSHWPLSPALLFMLSVCFVALFLCFMDEPVYVFHLGNDAVCRLPVCLFSVPVPDGAKLDEAGGWYVVCPSSTCLSPVCLSDCLSVCLVPSVLSYCLLHCHCQQVKSLPLLHVKYRYDDMMI